MKSIFDAATRSEVIARIDTLGEDSKPRWGKMTAGQMVRHCIICDEYYGGKFLVKRSFLGRLIGREALKQLLGSDRAVMRENSMTAPEFRVIDETGYFDLEKEKWIAIIEAYDHYDRPVFKHWFFGSMTKAQVGQLIYKHCDHHLRQFGR